MTNQFHRRAEQIKEAIDGRLSDRLLEYENAVEYSFGFAETDGKLTKEVSVIIHVTEKKGEKDLDDRQILPKRIAGFPVDVKEKKTGIPDREFTYRPLVGQVSGAGEPLEGEAGTLGAIGYEDSNGSDLIVTTLHTMGDILNPSEDEYVNTNVIQPSDGHHGTEVVGQVIDHGTYSGITDVGDVALVEIDSEINFYRSVLAGGELREWENPELGEWYVNQAYRNRSVFGQCIDIGSSTHGAEFARPSDSNLSATNFGGHSGSIWYRLENDGSSFPVAIHRASRDERIAQTTHTEIIIDMFGEITTTGSPGQPSAPSTSPNHETAIYDIRRDEQGDVIFSILTCNSRGDEDAEVDFRLIGSDSTELHTETVTNEGYEYTLFDTNPISPEDANDELTLEIEPTGGGTIHSYEYDFTRDDVLGIPSEGIGGNVEEEGVAVVAIDEDNNGVYETVSDENGNYNFGDLPQGTYHIYLRRHGVRSKHGIVVQ